MLIFQLNPDHPLLTKIGRMVCIQTAIVDLFHLFTLQVGDGALRVYVVSDQAKTMYPVLVVVRHEKGVLSWQLPMLVQVNYCTALKSFLTVFINIRRELMM